MTTSATDTDDLKDDSQTGEPEAGDQEELKDQETGDNDSHEDEDQSSDDDEAAFAAGFGETGESDSSEVVDDEPEETPKVEDDPKEKQGDDESGLPADESTNKVDEPEEHDTVDVKSTAEYKELQKRLRRTEGALGGLKDQIKAIQETTSNSGSAEQTKKVDDKLKQLEAAFEEFHELKPLQGVLDEFKSELESIKSGAGSSNDMPDVSEAIGDALLNYAHKGWQDKIASPEFGTWMLDGGGPESDEFKDFQQAKPDEAVEMLEDWKIDHPEWWEDKGQFLFSDEPNDKMTVMDMFSESQRGEDDNPEPPAKQSQRSALRRRQQRSVAPKGKSSSTRIVPGKSDEEAFAEGFKSA